MKFIYFTTRFSITLRGVSKTFAEVVNNFWQCSFDFPICWISWEWYTIKWLTKFESICLIDMNIMLLYQGAHQELLLLIQISLRITRIWVSWFTPNYVVCFLHVICCSNIRLYLNFLTSVPKATRRRRNSDTCHSAWPVNNWHIQNWGNAGIYDIYLQDFSLKAL